MFQRVLLTFLLDDEAMPICGEEAFCTFFLLKNEMDMNSDLFSQQRWHSCCGRYVCDHEAAWEWRSGSCDPPPPHRSHPHQTGRSGGLREEWMVSESVFHCAVHSIDLPLDVVWISTRPSPDASWSAIVGNEVSRTPSASGGRSGNCLPLVCSSVKQ